MGLRDNIFHLRIERTWERYEMIKLAFIPNNGKKAEVGKTMHGFSAI
jgi:hypothetical protein